MGLAKLVSIPGTLVVRLDTFYTDDSKIGDEANADTLLVHKAQCSGTDLRSPDGLHATGAGIYTSTSNGDGMGNPGTGDRGD